MLRERILSTIKFFDLQDYPLTLLELHKYLLPDAEVLRRLLDEQGEVVPVLESPSKPVDIAEVLVVLGTELSGAVESFRGFYHLPGRREIVVARLANYNFGIKREKLIRRFVGGVRHLPFVRGVAVGGSQAMGPQKATSDIDLLIITDPKFLWLARTLVTAYFQLVGHRRHGQKIANRFCLNHYLSHPKQIQEYRNLYTAMEYSRLRPVVYAQVVYHFQDSNGWIRALFPNVQFGGAAGERQSMLQSSLEWLLDNGFGLYLERQLKSLQLPRIRKGERFIVVNEDELSFHPHSKQQGLLESFLQHHT